ncbi:hypothetical protein, partial [Inquilinus limosus]|uniref:hypothetical protein n=1 Tax=Inquilinus limosus TaxID=171674 RepID=UPI001B7FEBE8
AGGAAGGAAGRWIGAAAGTALCGPICGVVGGIIGSRAGAMAGRALAGTIANMMEGANEAAETQTRPGEATQTCEDCNKQADPCAHLRRGNGTGPYRGGAHGETKKPVGDELDSHHTLAKDCFPKSMWDNLPAIQMDPLDHRKTMSNGNKGRAGADWRGRQCDLIKNGNFEEALKMDTDDIRRIAREAGDPEKYDEALKEMEEYARCREKHGLVNPDGAESAPGSAPASPGSSGPLTS